ncbi:FecR family protein [Sphingomonas quercus]|uniref:FecR domain-containing protein n=1 Tax=Sphingomonas quercus TaxID=2842451 RepID=A0ABS6BHE2_9SPHN|nr:FecR domain-containing protein [Sphingomonas quercus]MBU3077599.1 FecR domain-containing protein [Sphingomonas quercus]
MTARSEISERLLDEALAWHHALARDDANWEDYTLWLEADPLHRRAFDEVALTDRIVNERAGDLRASAPVVQEEPDRRAGLSRRVWLYGSMAAAIALALGVPAFWPQQTQADAVYTTAPGETKHIAMAQGINVDLAPASQLVLRDSDPTQLELTRGDAYFEVAHDPRRTLSITAGRYAVSDIGTRFGLNLSGDAVMLAVAEGHVSIAPAGGAATRVSAGQQLIARNGSDAARLGPVQAGDVGSWRGGRLVYSNAPLSIVAADIARYSGKAITVDPAIGDRPFSGVLAIGDGSRLLANLSDLMAISYQEKGGSVRIMAAPLR